MELFFRSFGEGPPLVILHGLYGSSDNWISIARALSPDFEVFLPDQRNHGYSPHDDRHDYPAMRDDLLQFMDDRQLDKASLVGHSMGGKAIMHFAVKYPEKVDSMIIVDMAPQPIPSGEQSGRPLSHDRILDAMLEVDFTRVEKRDDVIKQLERSIFSTRVSSFLMKNLALNDCGNYFWRMNVQTIRDSLESVFEGLLPGDYSGGKGISGFPVLFIRGGESDYIRDDMIPGIREIFPMAEITTIPDAGHWLHVEQTSLLIKTMKYFLLGA